MPDETEFVKLVWKMRECQRNYFARPIPGRLIAAKAAEKDVDLYIERQRGLLEFDFPVEIPPDEIPY